MGWKISAIIINGKKEIEEKQLLNLIGYKDATEITPKVFDEIMMPPDNEVYIAKYKGNWVICEQNVPTKSFEENLSKEEAQLTDYFNDAEVCTVALHSTVNFWGYSVAKNGKKLRVKAGSSDEGTFIDVGEPLKEEQNLLSKSKVDENGNRIYTFSDFPNEPFSEDQVGENFVFELCSRYFKEQLDADDELLDTKFNGYRFSKATKKDKPITSASEVLENEAQFSNEYIKWPLIFIVIIIIKYILKNFF